VNSFPFALQSCSLCNHSSVGETFSGQFIVTIAYAAYCSRKHRMWYLWYIQLANIKAF